MEYETVGCKYPVTILGTINHPSYDRYGIVHTEYGNLVEQWDKDGNPLTKFRYKIQPKEDPFTKLQVDDKILVRGERHHFKSYEPAGKFIYFFDNGQTSWSSMLVFVAHLQNM